MPMLTVRNESEITLDVYHRMVQALIVTRSGLYNAACLYLHAALLFSRVW
ncbi:MAG: hypothetical protein J5999_08415 [Oscillospiraceae bacterium]|nr:hypothetical protein [Oscillospiraceae bacterium]